MNDPVNLSVMISSGAAMSVIEDSRKVLQDFIAPELRAIAVRLDALDKRIETVDRKIDSNFAILDRKMDDRFDWLSKRVDELERRSEARHNEVMIALRQLMDLKSVQERLNRLESKEMAFSVPAGK